MRSLRDGYTLTSMEAASQELQPRAAGLSADQIENEAKRILQLHHLFSVPVDPVTLANEAGIKVHNAKFAEEGVSGAIAKRGSAISILVNQADAPFRKRFTIAHELGHHFLHLKGDGDFVDTEVDFFRDAESPTDSVHRRAEIEANRFAAALLMPRELLQQEFALDRSVSRLARRFNVSEEAMGYRLGKLALM